MLKLASTIDAEQKKKKRLMIGGFYEGNSTRLQRHAHAQSFATSAPGASASFALRTAGRQIGSAEGERDMAAAAAAAPAVTKVFDDVSGQYHYVADDNGANTEACGTGLDIGNDMSDPNRQAAQKAAGGPKGTFFFHGERPSEVRRREREEGTGHRSGGGYMFPGR